jgi:hypothetical protein
MLRGEEWETRKKRTETKKGLESGQSLQYAQIGFAGSSTAISQIASLKTARNLTDKRKSY